MPFWIVDVCYLPVLHHSLRLEILWESLWRKPSCTTGTTWTCRIWWITSKKRCLQPSVSHKASTIKDRRCFQSISTAYVIFGFADSFPHDMLHRFPVLCGSPLEILHFHRHINQGFPCGRSPNWQGRKYRPCCWICTCCHVLSFFDFPLSLNAVDGTTTQTGHGICTSTARLETPARSAAAFPTPAALPSPERYL